MERYISELQKEMIENINSEMEDWFHNRTSRHIELVREFGSRILNDSEIKFDDRVLFLQNLKEHDLSKYNYPEKIPYIFISWDYRMKDLNKTFIYPEYFKDQMNQATNHHVKTNLHHPEYWGDQENNVINREDRDKPLRNTIDVINMPDYAIAEMCADWWAMSKEKGENCPVNWAKKNINVRWKFTEKQIAFIYNIVNKNW